jgi:hypothetical protein
MAVLKSWTTRQLTRLGRCLAGVFGFGSSASTNAVTDTWTPETLASFGLNMSKGFGVGL